jgi:Flp pilus assembly protein TadG
MQRRRSEISMQKGVGRGGQQGSSLVEQALVLVILLTVMFAIIDFGRALYTYHFVSNAAREAARWASVRSQKSSLGAATPGNVQSTFGSSSALAGMAIDSSKITFNTTWAAAPSGPAVCPANQPGCIVQVQVKYPYAFMFPFLPTGAIDMQSTSRLVITQ